MNVKRSRFIYSTGWIVTLGCALAIRHKDPDPDAYSVGFFWYALFLSLLCFAGWLICDWIWKAYLGNIDTAKALLPEAQEQSKQYPNLGDAEQAYQQTITKAEINHARSLAVRLIQIRDAGFEIDLTEEYWVKSGKFKGSRNEFAGIKKYWCDALGALKRRNNNTNSPYDVADWRVIELIAQGERL